MDMIVKLSSLALVLSAEFEILEIEEKPNRYRGIWASWGEWSNQCKVNFHNQLILSSFFECYNNEEVIRSGPRNSLRRYR